MSAKHVQNPRRVFVLLGVVGVLAQGKAVFAGPFESAGGGLLFAAVSLQSAAVAADHSVDAATILKLRAENNQAIADHDIQKFSPMFAQDSAFIFSDGRTASGRAGITAALSADFADPAFVTYVRSPTHVTVSENGARAVEHGVWTALKRQDRGETRYGGDYAAHWARTPQGWVVRGELFVKLRCAGPLCTP